MRPEGPPTPAARSLNAPEGRHFPFGRVLQARPAVFEVNFPRVENHLPSAHVVTGIPDKFAVLLSRPVGAVGAVAVDRFRNLDRLLRQTLHRFDVADAQVKFGKHHQRSDAGRMIGRQSGEAKLKESCRIPCEAIKGFRT